MMQYREDFSGNKAEFTEFLKNLFNQMISNLLTVEGQNAAIPSDKPLDYKVKYTTDEEGASVTLKVSWANETETEDVDD
jgi:hypothetical protein